MVGLHALNEVKEVQKQKIWGYELSEKYYRHLYFCMRIVWPKGIVFIICIPYGILALLTLYNFQQYRKIA